MAFGEELGRPLRRADDPRDYVPCPSAMAPGGTNVVLFDPKLAGIGLSKLVEVHEVAISYDPIEDE